jgi:hypothetical protein
VKPIATGRLAQVAGRYSEHAPMAAVCCNACRTCVQTNVLALTIGGVVAFAATVTRFARRSVESTQT